MFYVYALLAFLVLLLFHFLAMEMRKPRNFPPGPRWYPIVGSVICVLRARKSTGMLINGIKKIAENYPKARNFMGFKIGKDRIVFTTTTKGLVEMYMNQDCDGRPFGPFYETRTWNLRRGVLLTDGDFYQTQQRFIVRQLKNFGFSRRGMSEICEKEAEYCLNDFRKLIANNGGKCAVVSMPNILSLYILNPLWQFMAGIRYDADNEELKLLQRLLVDLFKSIDMMGCLFSHFPFLQYVAPEASGYKRFIKCHNNIHSFMRKEVDRHRKNFVPSDEPKDLIDAYLHMIYAGDGAGKIHESFTESQLLAVCLDMFMAGSETTVKSSNFMLLHLLRNPSIQKRARKEIDDVIGRDRLPTLNDRQNLPYCEAIVLEALRMFMRYTCGIAHRTLRDTKLSGYDIPKNTMLIPMFNYAMTDPEIYKNPNNFDPENFLDDTGKMKVPDMYMPFGLGKHRCKGEVMAKSNLFLLCTTLIQNFYFDIPLGHNVPSDVPLDGATPSVREYKALIILRN